MKPLFSVALLLCENVNGASFILSFTSRTSSISSTMFFQTNASPTGGVVVGDFYQVWASFSHECFREDKERLKGLPWRKNRTEMRFSGFLV